MSNGEPWALILGASSGFGGATARALAKDGMNIIGVHLDRKKTLPLAEAVRDEIIGMGRKALFFNVNAADPEKRAEVLDATAAALEETGGGAEPSRRSFTPSPSAPSGSTSPTTLPEP
jgi:enoyl-[acyl-carrier protein] reductase III